MCVWCNQSLNPSAWSCLSQNVHLMQSWLPTLERLLETVVESADADFRCFISAEASPIPTIATCPESLLQVLQANQAPARMLVV
jgi:dynein heavy chain